MYAIDVDAGDCLIPSNSSLGKAWLYGGMALTCFLEIRLDLPPKVDGSHCGLCN